MKIFTRTALSIVALSLSFAGAADAAAVLQPLGSGSPVTHGYFLKISVGGGPLHVVQVDTGSVGVVVPRTTLGPGARDTGIPGRIEYTSSGRIFIGRYVVAKLTLVDAGGRRVMVAPMRVLAIDAASCDNARHPACVAGRSVAGVGMLGVGFARDTGSPDVNPFLHALDGGRSLAPAYVFTERSIVLGAESTDEVGFSATHLARASTDWAPPSACFAVGASRYCGTVLIDTGLGYAIARVPKSARPSGATAGSFWTITIDVPDSGAALAAREITKARWSSGHGPPFLNTGRALLGSFDYLYDAASGRVGFRRRPTRS
ncbi:MAG: hypothetical protein M3R30_07565 [Candidatus Eremiobacteraeota bacterium]|nr:hypothetical protein [Candidatus Eremiobacteraeota bacterium]